MSNTKIGERIVHMQEEISLREIIETIWDGKWIIAAVTALAVLVTGVYSFLIAAPVYEATALVRLDSSNDVSNTMNSIAETIRSDVSIHRAMTKLGMDTNENSISEIKSRIKVEPLKNANVLKVSMRGTIPENITLFVNLLAFEMAARFEITDRSSEIVNIKNRLEVLDNSLAVIESELSEIEVQLNVTPEKIYNVKSVSGESLLQSAIEFQSNRSSLEAGMFEMIEEVVNPVYLDLQNKLTAAKITFTKLLAEKKTLLDDIERNQSRIDQLESQIVNEKLTSRNLEHMLEGFNAVFISPAIEAEQQDNNAKLNLVLAFIIGVIIGVFVVFFRFYWKNSGQQK